MDLLGLLFVLGPFVRRSLLNKNTASAVTSEDHRNPLFCCTHIVVFGLHLERSVVKAKQNLGSL